MKNADVEMIQRLSRSNLYTEFKQAFGASVGLPLTLRPAEFRLLAHRSQAYENPFCAMIAQTNRGCATIRQAYAFDVPPCVRILIFIGAYDQN